MKASVTEACIDRECICSRTSQVDDNCACEDYCRKSYVVYKDPCKNLESIYTRITQTSLHHPTIIPRPPISQPRPTKTQPPELLAAWTIHII